MGEAVLAIPAHATGPLDADFHFADSPTGTCSETSSLRVEPPRLLTNSLTVRAMRWVPVRAACSRSSLYLTVYPQSVVGAKA